MTRSARWFGIGFSAPMVLAILEGRKTETRRLAADTGPLARAMPGDFLWVKEAFRVIDWDVAGRRALIGYMADGREADVEWPQRLRMGKTGNKLPRFMPREASRIDLSLIDRWRERLDAITDEGAVSEGIDLMDRKPHETDAAGTWLAGALSRRYFDLWDRINATRGHGRETEPLVDALRFRLLTVKACPATA